MPMPCSIRLFDRAVLAAALTFMATGDALAQAPPGPLVPLGAVPIPAANPQTPAKISLGAALFWDEQLSLTGTVACGSCHAPRAGGSDTRTLSSTEGSLNPGADGQWGTADDRVGAAGVPRHNSSGQYVHSNAFGMAPQVGGRQANSTLNAGFSTSLFWDGRAGTRFDDPQTQQVLIAQGGALENQALGPLVNDIEMAHVGGNLADVQSRLAAAQPLALANQVPAALASWISGRGYPALFEEVFGSADISPARIAMALASYQRSLVSNQTPHDLELSGASALTALERQGRQVFGQAGCGRCHGGALMSDHGFHYIGARAPGADSGRMAVTGLAADRGRMRTPGLRNVALSPPYMADGRFASLREVVEFYNRGGDFNAPNKAPQITPLQLSAAQIDALVAFLGRPLIDPRVVAESGPFERPQLYSESTAVPRTVSAAIAGGPRLIALEPPLAGRAGFTLGIDGGAANANARLLLDVSEPIQPDAPSLLRQDFALSPQGSASLDLVLPAASGQALYLRVFVFDATAPGGWRASETKRIELIEVDTAVFTDGFEP
ncbi:cytochrome-c peroxidase [Aquimonas sp.]|jgi:cytochrome c peroxidase|uniref:cytochrome-c peroxidase n=1 Tax=Aquimonas sp. TaxID=1872588 RepID=UPI0037BFFA98